MRGRGDGERQDEVDKVEETQEDGDEPTPVECIMIRMRLGMHTWKEN